MTTQAHENLASARRPLRLRVRNVYGWPLTSALLAVTVSLAFDAHSLSALGVGVVAYSFVRYVESLGSSLAIIEIISLIAAIQWIGAPFIAYSMGNQEPKYRMYVSEQEYMSFVVPALLLFILGMEVVRDHSDFGTVIYRLKNALSGHSNRAYLLIATGLLAGFGSSYVPVSLRFAAFFVTQLEYIGVLLMILSKGRKKWLVVGLVLSLTAVTSLNTGVFHNLILWSTFIFSFICLERQFRRSTKYASIVLGMAALILLQSVKSEYRRLVFEEGYSGSRVALVADLMVNSSRERTSASFVNARFNQGWIISAVMRWVPRARPFEEGETVKVAIRASLVPRFLVGKETVSVSRNFEKFTGLSVAKNTSMGISVLGEAYVNFGKTGGSIFMLVWGLLIGFVAKYLLVLARKQPTLIVWAPLIFLQVVKAETELLVVLNHGIKAIAFTWVFYFVARRFLRLNL